MASRFTFTDTDKEKIKAAVADLELESSGEIVPYFVQRSDDYDEVPWFSAVVFAVLSIVIVAALALHGTSLPILILYSFPSLYCR